MEHIIYKNVVDTKIGTLISTITQLEDSYDAILYIDALKKEYAAYHKSKKDAFFWLLGISQYIYRTIDNYVLNQNNNNYEKEVVLEKICDAIEYFNLKGEENENL